MTRSQIIRLLSTIEYLLASDVISNGEDSPEAISDLEKAGWREVQSTLQEELFDEQ